MTLVNSSNVRKGMVLKTWLGTRTIVSIEKYTGSMQNMFHNILHFDNGMSMSNEKEVFYELVYSPTDIKDDTQMKHNKDHDYGRSNTIDWILAGR